MNWILGDGTAGGVDITVGNCLCKGQISAGNASFANVTTEDVLSENITCETLTCSKYVELENNPDAFDPENKLYCVDGDLYFNGVDLLDNSGTSKWTENGDVLHPSDTSSTVAIGTNTANTDYKLVVQGRTYLSDGIQQDSITSANEFEQSGFNNGIRVSEPGGASGEVQIGNPDGLRVYSDAGVTETASIAVNGTITGTGLQADAVNCEILAFSDIDTPPSPTTNQMYTIGGNLFYNGVSLSQPATVSETISGNTTLSASDSGKTYVVSQASSPFTITLPELSAGISYSFDFTLFAASTMTNITIAVAGVDEEKMKGLIVSGSNTVGYDEDSVVFVGDETPTARAGDCISIRSFGTFCWQVIGFTGVNGAIDFA